MIPFAPLSKTNVLGVPAVLPKTQIAVATQRKLFLAALVCCDALLLALAFTMAYWLRFSLPLPIFKADSFIRPQFYLQVGLVLLPTWLGLFWLYGLYNWNRLLGGSQEYASVFHACLSGAILLTISLFFVEEMVLARGWVAMSWLFSFLLVILGRFALRRAAYWARKHGYLLANAILVGGGSEGNSLGQQLLNWHTSGLHLVGVLDDDTPRGTRVYRELAVLGPIAELPQFVAQHAVEEVILATSTLSKETLSQIFRQYGHSDQVQLRLSSGLFDLLTTGLHVKEMAHVPLIGVNKARLTNTTRFFKQVLECAIVIPALLLLAPFLLALAIWIKLDSPGPVIYRRRVVGLNGKQFDAFKFRTMRVDGDALLANRPDLQAELAANHKLKDDPRITHLGSTLRKYSLDEVPQLFNVLLGQMSLVGPRMITAAELEKYGQWDLNLQTVRPGLTGLWQVSGRSDVSYAERVQLDMFYIRNYSVWLDISIILQTIPAVLAGKGAY
jgi:exopolysaccharide biosynthesis polyprenyl glycosylphosphotransferase